MTYKVLIVDDSKLARMSAVKALKALKPDWERLESADADEALALAATQAIDLALLDYNMPGRDGITLAGELRALHPDILLALISANHQEEIVALARQVGAVFLPKPLTEAALKQFLAENATRVKSLAP